MKVAKAIAIGTSGLQLGIWYRYDNYWEPKDVVRGRLCLNDIRDLRLKKKGPSSF